MAFTGDLKHPGHGIGKLSLKQRFSAVIIGLLAVTVAFCALLLYGQHRTAMRGAEIAIRSQEEIVVAMQLREALVALESTARVGAPFSEELRRFRAISEAALAIQPEEISRALRSRLTSYAEALVSEGRGSNLSSARDRFTDALVAVNTAIDVHQESTYGLAEKLQESQERSTHAALAFLSIFIIVLAVASHQVLSIITQPLSALVRFLDQVDVEDDLPSRLPHFNTEVPEVLRVATSFERLLSRLRGYRALNVRRLLIERRRAEVIAASINDGIFLLRGEEILYVNTVAERILGGKLGKGFLLSRHVDEPAVQAILTARSRTIPVEYTVGDGERKNFYLVQTYPIDNSVIERAEHMVSGPVDEVMDRFQADTIVVAQDVTLVRESEEAKRHFLGTLSHEVRTPVTSLTMATRLLRRNLDQIENPTNRALIQTCIDDVERLRGLVEDLVTVSRFETLTQRMDFRLVDMAKLVRHSVQSFQAEARERGVELSCKVTPAGQPLQMRVDATKISWALSNLMTNALRHTPPKGKVSAELEMLDGVVCFRVQDTGTGIDRKRLGRIFDKFNPHYDLRVARSGGAGMGLAIAREIVVAHGGRISVTSEPGQGALFEFKLPVKGASTSAGEGDPALASGLKNQLSDGSGESLLLDKKGAIRGAPTSSG